MKAFLADLSYGIAKYYGATEAENAVRIVSDPKASTVDKTLAVVTAGMAITKEEGAGEKPILLDNATVVRGGLNTPKSIEAGTGTHLEGVTGVSLERGTCSVKDLAKPLPHNQIGVTTVGDVRKAGGDVIKTTGKSENHATLTDLSLERASQLLNPPIKNPNKEQNQ